MPSDLLDSEPKYYCFGCHREGTIGERGSGEQIRMCEICGLKFCHYCGHIDEASLTFLCNPCWKERASRLLSSNRFDQAIAIFEMLQDYDSIEDAVRLREDSKPPERSVPVEFDRIIIREEGEFRTATMINGMTVSDLMIRSRGKKGLLGEVGWKAGPVLWNIHENFKDRLNLQGTFVLDPDSGKVTRRREQARAARRYHVFDRCIVKGDRRNEWATHLDEVIVMDVEIRNLGKKDLVERYGWEFVTILIRIERMRIEKTGHYILDSRKGKVHLIGSMTPV